MTIEVRINSMDHRLKEIRDRVAAATPGPWVTEIGNVDRTPLKAVTVEVREVRPAGGTAHTIEKIGRVGVAEFLGWTYRSWAEAVADCRTMIPALLGIIDGTADIEAKRYWSFHGALNKLLPDEWLVTPVRTGATAAVYAVWGPDYIRKGSRGMVVRVAHDDRSDVQGDLNFIVHAVADARHLLSLAFDHMTVRRVQVSP